jgi:hypothetical protein
MTTTEDILALAANAASTDDAAADLALFAAAATRGANSAAVRALRTVRADHAGPAALPDSPGWQAWLSATAAIAGGDGRGPRDEGQSPADRAADRTVVYVVCAAATAVSHGLSGVSGAVPGGAQAAAFNGDCSVAVGITAAAADVEAAVAAGVTAAALVESRLADLADPGGWSLPAVSAVIGAGLATGLMLGLTPAELCCTLGICATQAAGLYAADSTDAGPIQAGKAAFNAVEAAQLARLGFTSSGEPLDGRRALFTLFGR